MELDKNLIDKEFVHFKGGYYRLVGYAKDSETLEPMCVYEALYGDGGLWFARRRCSSRMSRSRTIQARGSR